MGEAKLKARPLLTEAQRMQALGEQPFEQVEKLLVGMVTSVYGKTGGVNHELLGLDFVDGKVTTVNTLLVRRKEDAPHLRDQMLRTWPMVAHIFEAWTAPDTSTAPSKHPQRQDSVMIMMFIDGAAASIICRVDAATRTVEPGPMRMPERIEGNFRADLRPRQ